MSLSAGFPMLKYVSFASVLFALAASAACSASGSSNLPVLPSTLPATGLFLKATTAPGGLVVVLSEGTGTCADLGQNVKRKGESLVALSFAAKDPNGTPQTGLPLGTYPLVANADFASLQAGSSAVVFGLSQYDSTCNAQERFADSGSATLTRADSSTVQGTYDVVLGELHYTGTFDTAFCDPTASLDPGNATPQCE